MVGMTSEMLTSLVPAMATFAVFFWGQVTLPRQMEKLEKMIELFHTFKRMEQLEDQAGEESSDENLQRKSSQVLVAIQSQINSVYLIVTLGLWRIFFLLICSLLGIAAVVLVIRMEVIARFSFLSSLDNVFGDLISILVAELLAAVGVWAYLESVRLFVCGGLVYK